MVKAAEIPAENGTAACYRTLFLQSDEYPFPKLQLHILRRNKGMRKERRHDIENTYR